MALFSPGPTIAQISGNLGGVNFTRSPSGPVVRKRLVRTKHRTQRQLEQRATFQRAYSQWRDLSDLQRTAWSAAARGHAWTNRLALPKQISGWQLFLRITTARGHTILDPITTPPRMLASTMATSLTLSINEPATYTLAWDPGISTANYIVVAFGSRPFRSTPPSRFTNWRYLGSKSPPTQTWDIKTIFIEALGAPAFGEHVAVKFRSWRVNRLPSPFQIATETVW